MRRAEVPSRAAQQVPTQAGSHLPSPARLAPQPAKGAAAPNSEVCHNTW